MEFEAEELKPLGIVFNAYLDKHLAAARYRLKDDLTVQASQLDQLSNKQKALEAQAKAIAKAQVAFEAKAKAERDRAQRLNNEKFARYLDNLAWWIRVVVCSSRNMAWVVAAHWLILFPSAGLLGLQYVLSGPCFKQAICRSVISFALRNPLRSPLR